MMFWIVKNIFFQRISYSIYILLILLVLAFEISANQFKCAEALRSSDNFDRTRNKFININQAEVNRIQIDSFLKRARGGFSSRKEDQIRPNYRLPEVIPNLKEFASYKEGIHYIWFGHSTILVNFDGVIILFDPVFSRYASPFSVPVAERFQPSIINLYDLPDIDYVLISHDHYDHLDKKTIDYFVNKDTEFIVPLGLSSYLISRAIEEDRIRQLDWWEEVLIQDTRFVATPAQHHSGRMSYNSNKTLWASWVVQNKDHKIYFSGDSGYHQHFEEIGNQHSPFNIAFLETGQYNLAWQTPFHMIPEQTILAFKALKADRLAPIHWGMFSLSNHSWFDPIEKISRLAEMEDIELLTPKIGETISMPDSNGTVKWWRRLIRR